MTKNKKPEEEIKINEKNKKDYIQMLNNGVLLLVDKKQNQFLIDEFQIFIKRIDY